MWKLIKRSNLCLFLCSRLVSLFGTLTILCVAATSDRIGLEPAKSQEQAVKTNERSAAPNQPPSAVSISEPKNDDQHERANLLYELSYSAKCKTLPDLANTKSANLVEQFKEDDQFANLRDAPPKNNPSNTRNNKRVGTDKIKNG